MEQKLEKNLKYHTGIDELSDEEMVGFMLNKLTIEPTQTNFNNDTGKYIKNIIGLCQIDDNITSITLHPIIWEPVYNYGVGFRFDIIKNNLPHNAKRFEQYLQEFDLPPTTIVPYQGHTEQDIHSENNDNYLIINNHIWVYSIFKNPQFKL